MITLYDVPLSGNCHKVRLLLSFLAVPYHTHPMDLRGGGQRSPDYLQRNPFGQVPVLDDDGWVVRDSQAILVYADKVLAIIDPHLESRDWLVGDTVSIADLAIYPCLALAPEGGIDIDAYPNIVAWIQRIRALPGYVPMPGMWQA